MNIYYEAYYLYLFMICSTYFEAPVDQEKRPLLGLGGFKFVARPLDQHHASAVQRIDAARSNEPCNGNVQAWFTTEGSWTSKHGERYT